MESDDIPPARDAFHLMLGAADPAAPERRRLSRHRIGSGSSLRYLFAQAAETVVVTLVPLKPVRRRYI